jgi:hypothetical protein
MKAERLGHQTEGESREGSVLIIGDETQGMKTERLEHQTEGKS